MTPLGASLPFVVYTNKFFSDESGDCFLVAQADKDGVFRTKLAPGQYFIFFNLLKERGTEPFEYELADINVPSDTVATEITFQP